MHPQLTCARDCPKQADMSKITRHASSYQSYINEKYKSLLAKTGFEGVRFFPSFTSGKEEINPDLIAVVAGK